MLICFTAVMAAGEIGLFLFFHLGQVHTARTESPHIYCKIPRGKNHVNLGHFPFLCRVFQWRIPAFRALLATLEWFPMKPGVTSTPPQGFPWIPEGKQAIPHVCGHSQERLGCCGVTPDTSLDFLLWEHNSGCPWPEEEQLGPKGKINYCDF